MLVKHSWEFSLENVTEGTLDAEFKLLMLFMT